MSPRDKLKTNERSKPRVVVVGGYNADLLIRCETPLVAGKSVVGGPLQIFGGGRGANCAVAAARAGCDIVGTWSVPAERATAVQWVKALRDKLEPFAHGVYVNQLGETNEALVRAAYGLNYARLVEIKKKYDPENVLQCNQNIKPY